MKKSLLLFVFLIQNLSILSSSSQSTGALNITVINNTNNNYTLFNKVANTYSANGPQIPAQDVTQINNSQLKSAQLSNTFLNLAVSQNGNSVSSNTNYYTQSVGPNDGNVLLSISTINGTTQLNRINANGQPVIIFNNTTNNQLILNLSVPNITVKSSSLVWGSSYKTQQGFLFYNILPNQISVITRPDLQTTINSNGEVQSIQSLQTLRGTLQIMQSNATQSSGLVLPPEFASSSASAQFVQNGNSQGINVNNQQTEATFTLSNDNKTMHILTIKDQGNGYSVNRNALEIISYS